ncbi:zinc ABC transporter substrate-binding protein [Roseivivax sp. THAF30]|uniref:zinc ABC transporter substrate-binding protein n=1 Tax=Roseivivax sp. THAF30 TaxID=2587852 RepID=UPI00126795E2|nr:zinc ABC transporter substrate-binding protein [Roseivivax sp. THAF30]QFT62975.1 High-affinity zinc uptake system protein ZnuA precursor [Roseivivax sp. THAF30]
MSMTRAALLAATCLSAGAVRADVPNVAVDIAPVHSLVAQVMAGVGEPDLIVAPGASPHEYNLRPSEASALQDADLVIWIGTSLTPWLADSIDTLSPEARKLELLDLPETETLPIREGALFDAHDHGHGDAEEHEHGDDHAGHDHDDHDHEHADEHDHDHAEEHEHDDEHAGHDHSHDHGGVDPHAWLSPENANAWLTVIADTLSEADPENESTYRDNATAAQDRLETLTEDAGSVLDPVRDQEFIAFHDAYQYFETAFDVTAAGAISVSDASDPSPARVEEIRSRVADAGVACVLAEPQFNPGLVAAVAEGSEVRQGVVDPMGSSFEPGPDLYGQMMTAMVDALAECLGN